MSPSIRLVVAAFVAMVCVPSAPAQTNIWLGGTDAFWNNDPTNNWSLGAIPIGTHDVIFPSTIPGTGSTITLGTGDVANSLSFLNSYTLTGGDLTLTTGLINVDPTFAATITSVLNGGSTLTKTGTGTLILGASNGYTGGTTINVGTVSITNAGALGASGTINLGSASAGTDNASLLTSVTFARALTVQAGNSGTATFGGSNTSGTINYSGAITLNKGLTITQAAGGNLTFTTGFGMTGAQNVIFSPGAGSVINMNFVLSGLGGVGNTITVNGPGALELGSAYNPASTSLGAVGTKLILTQGRLQGVSGVSFNSIANLVEVNGDFALGSATASDKRSITFGNATPLKFNKGSSQVISINTASGRQISFQGGGVQFDNDVTFTSEVTNTARLNFLGGMTLGASRQITFNTFGNQNVGIGGALVGSGFDLTIAGNSTVDLGGTAGGMASTAVSGASSPRIVLSSGALRGVLGTNSFSGGVKRPRRPLRSAFRFLPRASCRFSLARSENGSSTLTVGPASCFSRFAMRCIAA